MSEISHIHVYELSSVLWDTYMSVLSAISAEPRLKRTGKARGRKVQSVAADENAAELSGSYNE